MGRHSTRYPAEVRDRAVPVFEHRAMGGDVFERRGCTTETLCRQAERDSGARPGMTRMVASGSRRFRELARRMLRKASAWFAQAELPPTQAMIAFIDEHRAIYGVEPICRVLPIAPSTYRLHAAGQRDPSLLPDRARRDEMEEIERVDELRRPQADGSCSAKAGRALHGRAADARSRPCRGDQGQRRRPRKRQGSGMPAR